MEANELMIGDIICQKFSNLVLVVSAVTPPYVQCIDEEGQFHEDTIKPIPLTPEILEKNGWVNDHFGAQRQEWWLDKTKFPIVRYSVNDTLHHNGIVLKFVHQLQHALKVCGIEKEIVP